MKQVIYFSANWCSSCQATEPAIEQLKRTGVQVAKINTDYDASLVEKYNVRNVPTIIILENGNEVKRHSGTLSFDQLKNLIKG
jgi:thioredoxin 1